MVQVCTFLKGTTIQWIEDQKVPYATKNNEWVGFDTQESYETKVGVKEFISSHTIIEQKVVAPMNHIYFWPIRFATCRSRSLAAPLCGHLIWMTLLENSVVRAITLSWATSANFLTLVSSREKCIDWLIFTIYNGQSSTYTSLSFNQSFHHCPQPPPPNLVSPPPQRPPPPPPLPMPQDQASATASLMACTLTQMTNPASTCAQVASPTLGSAETDLSLMMAASAVCGPEPVCLLQLMLLNRL